MPLDSSIPLKSVAPDPMASLSSLLDVGTKSLSLQKNRATFDADVALSKAQSSTAQSAATVNQASIQAKIDQNKAESSTAQSGATVNAANIRPHIDQQAAQTSTAQTGARNAAFDLRTKQRDSARQFMSAMLTDKNLNDLSGNYDPKKAVQTLRAMREYALANGNDPHTVETTMAKYMGAASNPGGVIGALKGDILAQSNPNNIPSAVNPNIQQTDSGNTIISRDQNSFSPGNTGNATAPVTKQLPPTQGTYGGSDGTTPGVIGPAGPGQSGLGGAPQRMAPTRPGLEAQQLQRNAFGDNPLNNPRAAANEIASIKNDLTKPLDPASRAFLTQQLAELQATHQAGSNPTSGFMATGLPVGQEANLKDNVEAMNTHFAKISGVASDAQLGLSLVSNIKSLANSAITGTLQGRTSYVNGLLNSVHLGDKITGDLQKDTDLLEKYLSQLNLSTPAATNAAREIITAARPHGTMIKGALSEAADQIGSVINSNLAVRNHLAGYKYANGGKGDAVNYDTEKRHIEGLADPRIFQLQGKSRDEIKTYMKTLPLADQEEMVRKSGLLHQMGITK